MADYTGKDFSSFEVESSMELVADQFTGTAPGADLFRNAAPADTVTLDVGLLDDFDVPTLERVMDRGGIDNWSLDVQPDRIVTTVRGRDQAALVKDATYRKIYRRPESRQTGQPPLTPIDPATGKPQIEEVFGRFYASDVVREICRYCGLTLHWGAPFDYELLSDFSAVGNALDLIRTLVEPFRQVEPVQCDLLVRGSMFYILQREMVPSTVTMTLDATETSPLTHIGVQRRPITKFGRVTLYGARNLSGTGINVFLLPSLVTDPPEVTEHYGPDKQIETITTITRTYYQPGGYLKKEVRETTTFVRSPSENAGTYVMTETIENTWDSFKYVSSATGALITPLMRESVTKREGVDPAIDQIKRVQETCFITYAYDSKDFLKSMCSIKKAYDGGAKMMKNSEMLVQTVTDVGGLAQEQVTETYGPDEAGSGWLLSVVERQPASGHRIGGPGRGGAGGGANNSPPLTVTRVFSTDKDAVDITYRNEHLNASHLDIIMAQFAKVFGAIETEIDFDGVSLPWLKGTAVHIRNLRDAEDVEIWLSPATVVDARVVFDESGEQPHVEVSGKALSWVVPAP